MATEQYVEFAGLTAEAVRLIEGLRKRPEDTKSEILIRALGPLQSSGSKPPKSDAPKPVGPKMFDFKEGIHLPAGEKLYLFLSRGAKYEGKPDAVGEIRDDGGFYMDGKLVPPSHGRPFQPAMEMVQTKKKHFSKTNGGTVALSSLRRWTVQRDGKFVALAELKDPALARTRGKKLDLSDLDLEL